MLISSILDFGFFLMDVINKIAPSTVSGLLDICGGREVGKNEDDFTLWQ